MFGLEIAGAVQPWVALGILIVMFVLFVRETYPVEVTAIGAAALFILLGILPVKEAVSQLSNPAPWTIVLMFLVMGGLVRTGAVEMVIRAAERHVGDRPKTTIIVLFAFIAAASAFMNNTPLVAVMIPVVMQIAIRLGTAPSKLLIPLSYVTVLGGMMTLIGTSTNLLVDGVAVDAGLEHFSLFEIFPLGLALTLAGGAFLALTANRLLPVRQSMGTLLSDRRKMKYFTEVAIPEDSPLIGQPVLEVDLFKRDGVRLIDVLRGDASLRRDLQPVKLEAGDRVVLRTEMTELLGLQQRKDLHLVDKLSSTQTETVEVLIQPGCRMEGRRLGELRLRRRYGVYVLAAHRRNQNIGRQLDDLTVRVGDTLLLEGAIEDIQRLAADMDLVDITRPTTKAFRRAKAPIAIAALAGVVILSGLELAPIMALGFLAVALILCGFALPAVADRGLIKDLFFILTMLTLAQYWNLLAGYGGLVSVGQQAFVGLGAYGLFGAAITWGMDPVLALPLGGLFALLVAIPTAFFAFRLAGAYFAIGTWVVAEVVRLSIAQWKAVGGGTGTSLPRAVQTDMTGTALIEQLFGLRSAAAQDVLAYWLALALAVLTIGGI